MRPPYSYYGGKSNMLPHLLPLIPKHTQYLEVFLGGGSLFWAKAPSKNEVLNDMNGHVTNFYMQLKTNFYELQKLIHGTLHSEILHKQTSDILDLEDAADPLQRAWALWVQTNLSFSFIIQGGYAFGTTGMALGTKNRRDMFTEKYMKRMEKVEIFNRDAIKILELKNHEESFAFVDPPYYNSNCAHYAGYQESDFINLLNCLQNFKGKFLLTCYPSDILNKYREEMSVNVLGEEKGWRWKDTKQIVSVTGKREETKYKVECMTWNYPPPNNQESLFEGLFTEGEEVVNEELEQEEF